MNDLNSAPEAPPGLVQPAPVLLLISAPSGGGKTTVCARLLASVPGLTRVITCTTRPPRQGEKHGVDYYFLAGPVFAQMLAAGQFLEHAMVYGHYYGVARQEVATDLDDNKDALLSVDVQGAATIRAEAERWPQLRRSLVTVFLMPSSPKVLAERLRKRDQDTPEVIQHRLQAAQAEMARWPEFDYLVPSTTMEEDLRRVQVIYEAEKMRPARAPGPGLPKRT